MKNRSWLRPAPPEGGRWGRWLLARLVTVLVLLPVLAVGGGLAFKNRLIFHPEREVDETPLHYGLNYEEFELTTAGGLRIKAWRVPPPEGQPFRTVLLFQGNSGNMSLMSARLAALQRLGAEALAVDYPGYGQSEGRPSEEAAYQSAEALWNWALSRGARPENIVIYGFSLGGGVASYLAWKHPPAALALDSTFTRLRDVPSAHLPLLAPYFQLVLGEAFDTRARLGDIRCPLLLLHSPADNVVPYALGQELYQGYQNNKKELLTGVGGHLDFLLNLPLYSRGLERLLAAAAPQTPPISTAGPDQLQPAEVGP